MAKKEENQGIFLNKISVISDRVRPYVKYIIRRLIVTLPVIFIISVIIYTLIYIMPGDPIFAMLDPEQTRFMTPEQKQTYIENMRIFLGYDKGFVGRYFVWWGDILSGNYGYSIRFGTEVSDFLGPYIRR